MAVLSLPHLLSFISNQSFYLPSAVASFPSRLSELRLGRHSISALCSNPVQGDAN